MFPSLSLPLTTAHITLVFLPSCLSLPPSQGNGIMNCDAANEASARAAVPQGYGLRGSVEVRRFDEVMPYEDIKAIKVRETMEGCGCLLAWYLFCAFTKRARKAQGYLSST